MENEIALKPLSVMIAGYYGFGNAGDELILLSLVQQLRRDNSDLPITVLSNDPAYTRLNFDVQALDRWRPWTWVRALFDTDLFILGGGGLLQESTGPWNHLYYLSLLLVAKLFGCRTEVWALGVDPVKQPWNRFLTSFILNHFADRVSVRDHTSHNALLNAGVSFPIERRADPVFALRTIPPSHAPEGIALAVAPRRGHPEWSRTVAEFCNHLARRTNAPIDLLVFFPAEDEAFARTVAEYSDSIRRVRVWLDPRDLLFWVPTYRLVAGTRFHALLLAALSRRPFIGWGNQAKVQALCQQHARPFWSYTEGWDQGDQLRLFADSYQSTDKSVILVES